MEEYTREAITQNLVDAGCDGVLISEFWRLSQQRRSREVLELLSGHRKRLLERCHTEQKKLDCLDYLVYQLEHGRM